MILQSIFFIIVRLLLRDFMACQKNPCSELRTVCFFKYLQIQYANEKKNALKETNKFPDNMEKSAIQYYCVVSCSYSFFPLCNYVMAVLLSRISHFLTTATHCELTKLGRYYCLHMVGLEWLISSTRSNANEGQAKTDKILVQRSHTHGYA